MKKPITATILLTCLGLLLILCALVLRSYGSFDNGLIMTFAAIGLLLLWLTRWIYKRTVESPKGAATSNGLATHMAMIVLGLLLILVAFDLPLVLADVDKGLQITMACVGVFVILISHWLYRRANPVVRWL